MLMCSKASLSKVRVWHDGIVVVVCVLTATDDLKQTTANSRKQTNASQSETMCLIEIVASPTIDILPLSWKSRSAHVLKGFPVEDSGLA